MSGGSDANDEPETSGEGPGPRGSERESGARGSERESVPPRGGRGPDPLVRTLAIAGFAILLALALTFLFSRFFIGPRIGNRPQLAFLLSAKLFVSTFNVVVLLALVAVYGSVYREMPNPFTLSLVLFALALLLYALTSNPVVHVLLGFRGGPQLGPFTFVPDLFAGVAIVVLLYQSYR